MLSAVLFDLDGTLLDLHVDTFLADYFRVLGPVIARLLEVEDPRDAITAVTAATAAMMRPHPGQTNKEAFDAAFFASTGLDLTHPAHAAAVESFYANEFPGLRKSHASRSGANAAFHAAKASGLRVALATNPIFPLAAIRERAAWAGFDLEDFDLVTSYETARACKPHRDYYLAIAEQLGVEPSACLMVGDDAQLDLPAADCGMLTYYVGEELDQDANWSGDLDGVALLLRSSCNQAT